MIKMNTKCPGQDLAFMNPDKVLYYVKCKCDNDVEFWYDDKKRKCDSCGDVVQPDLEKLMQYHGCSSYCTSALECLGEDKYVDLVLKEKRAVPEAKKELENIINLSQDEKIKNILKPIIEKNIDHGYLLDIETDLNDLKKDDKTFYDKTLDCLKQYILRK